MPHTSARSLGIGDAAGIAGPHERSRRAPSPGWWARLAIGVAVAGTMSGLVTTSGANAASAGSTLIVVAHQDDALAFMNPDLNNDIQQGRSVETVYITTGANGLGTAYWQGREQGAMAATAEMAGVANSWSQGTMSANGYTLVVDTLVPDPSLTIVFMRLPDGNLDGSGFPDTGNQSLQALWTGGLASIQSADGLTFTKQNLIDTLAAIMNAYQPDIIRTQNYLGSFGTGDHSDHVAVGFFTTTANQQYTSVPHTLLGYQGYPISELQADLFGAPVTAKENAWVTYAAYDPAVCGTVAQCTGPGWNTSYGAWFFRQFIVASTPTDTTPPQTAVGLPASGATVKQALWIAASASDFTGVTSLSFEVTGGSLTNAVVAGGVDTVWGWLGLWDTTKVPNGTYTLQSVATDAVGNAATSAGVTVSVNNTTPLAITTSSLSNGWRLASYSAALSATGGQLPYAWSLLAGRLPRGLTLNASTGVISGKPNLRGTFMFTIKATDSSAPALTSTKTFTIRIS